MFTSFSDIEINFAVQQTRLQICIVFHYGQKLILTSLRLASSL